MSLPEQRPRTRRGARGRPRARAARACGLTIARVGLLVGIAAGVACCEGETVEVGAFAPRVVAGGEAGTSLGGAGGTGAAGGHGGAAPSACEIVSCNGKVYDCGNCVDDDGDGLVDALDPECLGACDDIEDTLDAGFSDEAISRCTLDCYFDEDSGIGNDGCLWDRRCDALSGAGLVCTEEPRGDCDALSIQSDRCQELCLPLVPNGCDCFGCCEVRGRRVFVGTRYNGLSTCTLETLDDPLRCLPCTPVPSCQNACDPCELCVGKSELPPECGPDSSSQCPDGVLSCGRSGQSQCGAGYYCVTGCCVRVPQ